MSQLQAFRIQVQLSDYRYIHLLACVPTWNAYRDLVRRAGHRPPAGKPKWVAAPREEAEFARRNPGVLFSRDMDEPEAAWTPVEFETRDDTHDASL